MAVLYKKNYFLVVVFSCCLLLSCKRENSLAPISLPAADTTVVKIPFNPFGSVPVVDTATKVIVVLGSSSAAGYGASNPDSAWVNRVKNKLLADKKRIRLVNLAVPGYTTFTVMPTGNKVPNSRPQSDTVHNITAALKNRPSLVIINLPTNDIASNFSDDETLNNYHIITHLLDSAHVAYIITGTQPRNFNSYNQRLRLKTFNDEIALVYPNNICDLLNLLSSPSWSILDMYNSGDGIHVNDKGHSIIYESIINHKIIKNLFSY